MAIQICLDQEHCICQRLRGGGTKGETVVMTKQQDNLNPIAALHNHSIVNKIGKNDPIACYTSKKGEWLGLTIRRFIGRVNDILKDESFQRISGHCFHIGGTTNLLLMGVPPDIV